jgi:hypothetical protein
MAAAAVNEGGTGTGAFRGLRGSRNEAVQAHAGLSFCSTMRAQ